MRTVGIVVVICFMTLCVGITAYCVLKSRYRKRMILNPSTRCVKKVCKKLRVAALSPGVVGGALMSPAKPESVDLEAATTPLGVEECSICIGPLMPPPAVIHDSTAHPGTGPVPRSGPSVPGTAAHPITSPIPSSDSSVPDSRASTCANASDTPTPRLPVTPAAAGPKPRDGDIANSFLTLATCGHSFHAKCLTSWFLTFRVDCPVCRTPFYERPWGPRERWETVMFGDHGGAAPPGAQIVYLHPHGTAQEPPRPR